MEKIKGEKIVNKINQLADFYGVKKEKLGEILGASSSSSRQWKYDKINAFFKKLKEDKIDLQGLEKIAQFFGKSLDYFLYDDENYYNILRSQKIKPYKTSKKDDLEIIHIKKFLSLSPEKREKILELFANEISY